MQVSLFGQTSQSLPQAKPENVKSGRARFGRYNEQYVHNIIPDMGVLALEGSVFVVNNNQTQIYTNATVGSFIATNPFLLIYNSSTEVNQAAKRIIMDSVMLLNLDPGIGGVSLSMAITLDAGNRYVSGGTNLSEQVVNPNADFSAKSIAKVYAGNIVASAATPSARSIVGWRLLKNAIPAGGDQYTIKFGSVNAFSFINTQAAMTFTLNSIAKVVIPPNWSMMLNIWLPSQTGASSYAPEVMWAER